MKKFTKNRKVFLILPYYYDPINDSRSYNAKVLSSELEKMNLKVFIFSRNGKFRPSGLIRKFIFNSSLLLNFHVLYNVLFLKPKEIIVRPDNMFFWFPIFLNKDRICYNIHSHLWEEIFETSLKNAINIFFTTILRKVIFSKKNKYIFNHRKLEYKFKELYNLKKTISISNGSKDSVPIKRKKYVLKKSFKAVFIGAITRWRDINIVQDFFNKYDSHLIKFYCVGKIYNYELNPDIEYLGTIPFNKLKKNIDNFDFAVLNVSDYKSSPGSPIKLYDYAMLNLPILSISNIEGYSDLVQKYNLGLCVDFYNSNPDDYEKLKLFLEKINNNEFKYNSFVHFLNNNSWKKKAKDWYNFINSKK